MGVSQYPVVGVDQAPQTLGYATVNAVSTQNFGTTDNPPTDLTGLTVTVTVPPGRRIRITGYAGFRKLTANGLVYFFIMEGASKLAEALTYHGDVTSGLSYQTPTVSTVVSPTAGTHTYKLAARSSPNDADLVTDPVLPAFILVEDITGSAQPAPPTSVPVGLLARNAWVGSQAVTQTTVTLPMSANVAVAEGRTLRIYARTYVGNGTANARSALYIFEDGVQIQSGFVIHPSTAAGTNTSIDTEVVFSPTAGAHTYEVRALATAGTSTFAGSTDHPAYITVEDVTPTPAPATGSPSSTLGYANRVTDVGTFTTTETDLGVSVTVVVPAGRRLKLTAQSRFHAADGDIIWFRIKEGSTTLNYAMVEGRSATGITAHPVAIVSPSAGTHTYTLTAVRFSGTGSVTAEASADTPTFLLVEDITAALAYGITSLPAEQITAGAFGAGSYTFTGALTITGAVTSSAAQTAGSAYMHTWRSNAAYATFGHKDRADSSSDYSFLSMNTGTTYVNAASGAKVALRVANTDKAFVDDSGVDAVGGRVKSAEGHFGTIRNSAANGAATIICINNGNGWRPQWDGTLRFYIESTNVKNFIIPHPVTPDEKYLIHTTLEGPENAVFYRGVGELVDGRVVVKLPDYFEALCAEEGRSVQLTCIADDAEDEWCPVLHATYPTNGEFHVGLGSGMAIPDQRFWWEVKAIRRDVEPLLVEPNVGDIDVLGEGPYTHYRRKGGKRAPASRVTQKAWPDKVIRPTRSRAGRHPDHPEVKTDEPDAAS